jgi:hypothetical protein
MTVVLHHPDACLWIEDRGASRFVSVEPSRTVFTPLTSWVTAYPIELIEKIFKKKGAWVVEEIVRDENPRQYQLEVFWEMHRSSGAGRCC